MNPLVKSALQAVKSFIEEFDVNEKGKETSADHIDCSDSKIVKTFFEKLQQLSRDIQTLVQEWEDQNAKDAADKKCTTYSEKEEEGLFATIDTRPAVDPELVQIRANKSEIERRIAAFIEKKQMEVDDTNRREFCGVMAEVKNQDSCARTDAVFTPRLGAKSHVKVTKVENKYGPQTLPGSPRRILPQLQGTIVPKQEPGMLGVAGVKREAASVDGIEERLHNMEDQLQLATHSKASVFERLQKLENRILHLESLSPEYFNCLPPVAKQKKVEKLETEPSYNVQSLSIGEIDSTIQQLRQSLLNKSRSASLPTVQQ